MIRRRIFIQALSGSVVIGWLLVSPMSQAQTPTPISACGTITGSVILTQDISTINSNCLTIGAANTIIEGNGKSIIVNSSGHGIFNFGHANLTVRNLSSNSDIYINGESTDNVLIENVVADGVNIIASDDVVIRNSSFEFAVLGQEETEAQRITFTGNVVRGTGDKLVAIRGSGIVPCAPSNHVFTNNTLVADNACTPGVDCDEPMAVFIWCSSGSTYANNSITSTARAQGIRLRDESDNNTFANNTVWVSDTDGDFGALNITSGNSGKHHPRDNTFTNNLFRSDTDLALNIQSPDSGNRFEHNVFWSNTGGIANLLNDGSNGNTWDHNTFFNAGSAPALHLDYWNNRTPDTFTNNIVASNGPTAVRTANWSFGRYTGNHNLFYSSTPNTTFYLYGPLSGWQSAAAPDDSNSLFSNPLFTNAAIGIFTIQENSPARNNASDGSNIGALGVQTGPPACTETWTCGDWSPCSGNSQSRSCTDSNGCGTTNSRPPLTQSCVSGPDDQSAPAGIANLLAQ